MKAIFYTTLLSFFLLGLSFCTKKVKSVEDSEVIVYDTPARGEDTDQQQSTDQEERRGQENTLSFKTDDFYKLKRYNVVVATLTQPNGVEALKRFFERDGIDYFVVRSPEGKYYFMVHSSDSEEAAMDARSAFLVRTTVDKSRQELWHQYYVQLTDAFILER